MSRAQWWEIFDETLKSYRHESRSLTSRSLTLFIFLLHHSLNPLSTENFDRSHHMNLISCTCTLLCWRCVTGRTNCWRGDLQRLEFQVKWKMIIFGLNIMECWICYTKYYLKIIVAWHQFIGTVVNTIPLLSSRMFYSRARAYPVAVFSVIKYDAGEEKAKIAKLKAEDQRGLEVFELPQRDWRGK